MAVPTKKVPKGVDQIVDTDKPGALAMEYTINGRPAPVGYPYSAGKPPPGPNAHPPPASAGIVADALWGATEADRMRRAIDANRTVESSPGFKADLSNTVYPPKPLAPPLSDAERIDQSMARALTDIQTARAGKKGTKP